jgi:arsenate reductase-like glutaredoxin family protein
MSTAAVAVTSVQKIIIGGWTAYAEEHGVNKKESVETFDWLPPPHDAFAYKDLKNALDKVDGAREWLKTYVKKSRHDYSFSDLIGDQIRELLTVDHSGASGTGLMWDYKRLLNDWDDWVFAKKRYSAMDSYKKTQINPYTVDNLLWRCEEWLEEGARSVPAKKAISAENILKFECSKYNHQFTSVPDLKSILTTIRDDWDVIMEEDRKEYNEGVHRELIESIEFLYEHPMLTSRDFIPASEAVVTRGWKYILWPDWGVEQLFDLARDPYEERDLVADPAHAPRLAVMRADLARLKSQAR